MANENCLLQVTADRLLNHCITFDLLKVLSKVATLKEEQTLGIRKVMGIYCRERKLTTFATWSLRDDLFSDLLQNLISATFNFFEKNGFCHRFS